MLKLVQLVLLLCLLKAGFCRICTLETQSKLQPHNMFNDSDPFLIIYLKPCDSGILNSSLYLNFSKVPSGGVNDTCRLELYFSYKRAMDKTSVAPALENISIRFWTDLVDLELAYWKCDEIPEFKFNGQLKGLIKILIKTRDVRALFQVAVKKDGPLTNNNDGFVKWNLVLLLFPLLLLGSIFILLRASKLN